MKNESGIIPIDLKVLVLPFTQEEMTAGGIVLPSKTRDQEDMGGIEATLIAVGVNAFEAIQDKDQRPKPGMRVSISKYGGYLIKGKDGEDYRLINDLDVSSVLDGDWDIRSKV